MSLLFLILAGLLAIAFWFVVSYRRFVKRHGVAALWLLLLCPAGLSAQCVDGGCYVGFRWLENRAGKLECQAEGVGLEFLPGGGQWKVIVRNCTEDEVCIDWGNAQLILNGRATKTDSGLEEPVQKVGSREERSRTFRSYDIGEKGERVYLDLYDRRSIRKGSTASVSLTLPISVGNRPKYFHKFDFIVTDKPFQ